MSENLSHVTEVSRFTLNADGESLSCLRVGPDHAVGQLLLMHGAGTGNKDRYKPIIDSICEQGLEVIAFDFSGHGESSGTLAELSLKRRFIQASAVMSETRRSGMPMIIMGFSMSGQTVCDLLNADSASRDISAAVLCCPAAYAADVYELPFGDPNFTAGLRRPGSWETSANFAALRDYSRPVLIVEPELDEVIPSEVIARTVSSRESLPTKHLILPGCPHKIAVWLADKPMQRKEFAAEVFELVASG